MQAVEVTKVSLLLKCLEGESEQTVQRLMFAQERALPDLAPNIKCGNSLVGSDVFDDAQALMFDEEESLAINAFDWEAEFSEIAGGRNGGFEAIVGNPPYVCRKVGTDELKAYYRARYQSAEGKFDLYKFFLERSSELLAPGGRLAMIVSATCLVQGTFKKLRTYLLDRLRIDQIAALGPGAFKNATVDTVIFVGERAKVADDHSVEVIAPTEPRALLTTASYPRIQDGFRKNSDCVINYRLTEEGVPLVKRMFAKFPSFDSQFEIGVGINTGYIKAEMTSDTCLDDRYHPMLPGTGISRYGPIETKGWIVYDSAMVQSYGSKGRTLPPERLMSRSKILVVRTRNLSLERRIIATLDDTGAYNLNRLTNIIARKDQDLHGLLAILNSRLIDWLFSTSFYDYEIKPVYLKKCPLAACDDPGLIKNGKALDTT
ncbi:N-6 DNA methylase, partial [bacterium]|nr:N-6 DNA methylase [bacterium]